MAKFIPTTGNISFAGTTLYAINCVMTETVEQGDVTDGNTGGDGREKVGGRVERTLSCDLWVEDGTAEPAANATGALTIIAKPAGVTAKSYAFTKATIVSKGTSSNPAGTDALSASYEFALDGAPTLAQFT